MPIVFRSIPRLLISPSLVFFFLFLFFSTPLASAIPTGTGSEEFPIGTDANDEFNVGTGKFIIQGAKGNVGIGTITPVGGLAVMSGNVGIGTWSPVGSLEVKGGSATRIWTGAGIDTNATGAGELYVEGDLEVDGTIYGDGSGITALPSTLAAGGWVDGGANVYQTTTTDKVGIGTTTPATTLEIVKQAANAPLMVSSTASGAGDFLKIDSGGAVGIGTTDIDAAGAGMIVMNGNVGLGSVNPTQKLDVSGAIHVTTNVNVDLPGNYSLGGLARVLTSGSDTVFRAPSNNLLFQGNSATFAAFTSTGNFGIGTTAPVAGLSVMNGNVGIGTWSPIGSLEVKGGNATRIWTGAGTDTNATSAGELYVEGDLEVDGTIYGDGSGITALPSTLAAGGWVDGGPNVYQTTTTDNVGIGTTTPATTFEIVKSSNRAPLMVSGVATGAGDYLKIDSSGNIGIGTSTAVGALTVMNGNIGIGTWSPTAELELNGFSGTNGPLIKTPIGRNLTVHGGAGATLFLGAGAANAWSVTSAYSNALLNVGIGTSTPVGALTVMSGNVGIGTWSPIGSLEVRGGSATRIWTGAGTDTNATSAGELYVEGDLEVDGTIYGDGSGITALPSGLPAGGWTDGGPNVYTTTTTDKVGIGTTTPATTLEIVKQAANAPLMVSSTAAGAGDFFKIDSAGNIGIGTVLTAASGVSIMNGNVGIGTWTPQGGLVVMNGSVGIGTTSPSAALEVGASGGIAARIRLNDASDNQRIFFANGGTDRFTVGQNGGGLNFLGTATSGAARYFKFSVTDAMTNVDNSNRSFSINTKFNDAANKYYGFVMDVTNTNSAANSAIADFRVGGTSKMFLDVSGNVGIGTATPIGALTVMNGNVGIGTWSPIGSLEVKGGSATRIWTGAGTDTNATGAGELYVEGDLEVDGTIYGDGSGITALPSTLAAGGWVDGGPNVYQTTTTDNVGIGTTTPATTFEIVKSTNRSPIMISSVATGAGDFLKIDSSGNVGLGTALSGSGLVVMNGNVGIGTWKAETGRLVVAGTGGKNSGLTISNGVSDFGYLYLSGNDLYLNSARLTTSKLFLGSGGSDKQQLVIDGSGNVGIGTTIPIGGLTVMNGNVGIGTWSPTSPLQVVGDVTVTDDPYGLSWDGSTAVPTKNAVYDKIETVVSGGSTGWIDGGPNVYTTTTTDNVGIGTTTPNAATLEVVKNAAQSPLKISSGATGAGDFLNINSAGRVGIGTTLNAANTGLSIMNGSVGIGTWSTTAALYVQGQIGATGSVFIPSGQAFGVGSTHLRAGTNPGDLYLVDNSLTGLARVQFGGTTSAFPALARAGTSLSLQLADGTLGGSLGIGTTAAINGSLIVANGNVGIGTLNPVNGTAIMNGNVGIGTWSPVGALEVKGGQGATRIWTGAGTDTNALSAGELYVEGDLEVDGTIYGDGSGITALPSTLAAGGWVDGGPNVYQTTTTDNVGIGTTTPATTLEVVKTSNRSPLMISSVATGAGDYLLVTSSGNIGIGTTANAGAVAIMNGNVGIGTWSPTASLQVNGLIKGPSSTGLTLGNANNQIDIFGHTVIHDSGTVSYLEAVGQNLILRSTTGDAQFFGPSLSVPPLLMVKNSGNVGIGTDMTSATSKFSVYGGNVGIGTIYPVNGTAIMNGNVGIGTWSPVGALEVKGGQGATRIWTGAGTDTNATSAGELYVEGDLEVDGTIYGDGSGITALPSSLPAGGWTDGGTNVFLSTTTDNVGIGTTTPATTLEVVKTSNRSPLMISSVATGAGDYLLLTSSGNVGVGTITPVGAMAVMNGNVGIGTWSPTAKLQVVGTVAATAFTGDGSALTGLSSAGGWTDGGPNVYESTTTDVVGIGTTTPAASTTLEIVKQATNAPFKISSTATGAGDFLKIDSAGNIGIGTTSTANGALSIMSGNVGIGSINPGQALDVHGYAVLTNNFAYQVRNTSGVPVSVIRYDSSNQTLVGGNNEISLHGSVTLQPTSTSNALITTSGGGNTIISGGNVGIGTTTPVGALTVMSGSVGIGTWSPLGALEVKGGQGAVRIWTGAGTDTNATSAGELYVEGDLEVDGTIYGDGSGITALPSTLAAGGWVDGGPNVYQTTTTDNVGIGTTTPATTLEIVKSSNRAPLMVSSVATGVGDFLKIDSSGNIGIGTTNTTLAGLAVLNGNVGIGTINPHQKLDVTGIINASSALYVAGGGSFIDASTLQLGNSSTRIGAVGTTTVYGAGNNTTSHIFRIGAVPMMTIDSSGNVGIGTDMTSATAKLAVMYGNVGFGTTMPVGGLTIMNGNVGIGTWSPTSQLQVIGNVSVTDDPYGVTWDGSTAVPTKNAVYDKIETVVSGGSTGWIDGGPNVYTTTTTDSVGIGTTTPNAATLEIVKNAAQPLLKLSSGATGAGDFLKIDSAGNIGIGTTDTANSALSVMNGNVGIGTWKSVSPLTIYSSQSDSITLDGGVGSDAPRVRLFNNITGKTGTDGAVFGYANGNEFYVLNYENGPIRFMTQAVDRMKIMGNGNVGIGTISPNGLFIVEGGNVGIGTTFPVKGTSIMNGNVGIGTWSPVGALEVKGGQGATRIWTGAGTDTNALSAGELYVEGDLEVDGTIYGDGSGITALPSTLAAGGWVDGGANVYQTTTTDKVGIGTTTPATTLEIVKQSSSAPLMISSVASGGGDYVVVTSSGNIGIGTTANAGALALMNGNVGIGTWAPTAKLQVVGTIAATAFTGDGSGLTGVTSGGGWTDGGTNVYTSTTTDNVGIGTTTPTAALLVQNAGTQDSFRVNDSVLDASPFLIDAAGNVGIGTTTPGIQLDVVGSIRSTTNLIANNGGAVGAVQLYLNNAGGGVHIAEDNDVGNAFITGPAHAGLMYTTNSYPLWFGTSSTIRMLIDPNGNVGIGTITPVGGLTVMNGNVGIGTWSPIGQLEVKGGSGATRIWTGAGTDTNALAAGELYVEGDLEVDGTIYGDGSGITGGTITNAGGWTDGGTNVFESTTTDNVGIGTTTPATTLEIVKSSNRAPLMVSSVATGVGDFLKIDSAGNIGIGTTLTTTGAFSIMNGNVGIGTWNPSALLQVGGSTSTTNLAVTGIETVNGSISITGLQGSGLSVTGASFVSSNAASFTSGAATGSALQLRQATGQTANLFQIVTPGSVPFTVFNSVGYLGIGTINPLNRLVVNGGVGIGTLSSSSFIDTMAPNGGLIVEKNVGIGTTTPSGALTVMNGNVGIGTWNPTSQLQVIGNVSVTDDPYAVGWDGSTAVPTKNAVYDKIETVVSGGSTGWIDGGPNVYTTTTTDNVGIGTTTPNAATLEIVKNAAQPPLKISSTATGAGDFLKIDSAGNIGIGTTTPVGALTIMNGNVGIGTWSPNGGLVVMNGNMGIGLSAPAVKLDVQGNSGTDAFYIRNSAGTAVIRMTPIAGNVGSWVSQFNGAGTETVRIASYTDSYFNSGNVGIGTTTPVGALTVMNGNVGIGTWSPLGALEVKGGQGATRIWTGAGTDTNATAAGELYVEGDLEVDGTIYGDGSGITGAVANGGGWVDGGANIFEATTTDKVGIGTTNPATTLEIVKQATNAPLMISSTATGAGDFVTVTSAGRVGIGTTLNASGSGLSIMNGNVGIGTWSPVEALQVVAGRVALGDTAAPGVTTNKLYANGGNLYWNGVQLDVGASAGGWVDGGTNVFEATTSDVVGIGTTTPSALTTLEIVKQASNAPLKISSSTAGAGDFLTIASNGNIGVGTTNPRGALTIMNGNVGIGTWSPIAPVEIVTPPGSIITNAVAMNIVEGSTRSNPMGIGFSDGRGYVGQSNSTAKLEGGGGKGVALAVNASSGFGSGTVVLTGTITGNIGIGTTTPVGGLTVMNGNVGIGTWSPNGGLIVMNGNVGIGSISPANPLEIYFPGQGTSLQFAGTGGSSASITNTKSGGTLVLGAGLTGGTGNIQLNTGGSVRTIVDTTGNVGIGTIAPVGALTVMNGNVGIGTWSPIGPLEVKGGTGATRIWTGAGTDTNATSAGELYVEGDLEVDGTIYGDGSGLTALPSTLPAGGWTDGGPNVFLTSTTDSVGIGTTSPIVKLQVDGGTATATYAKFTAGATTGTTLTDGFDIGITSAGNAEIRQRENAYIDFFTNGVQMMRLASGGNVGIGTTTPVGALTVMSGNVGIGTWSPNQIFSVRSPTTTYGMVGSSTDANGAFVLTGSPGQATLQGRNSVDNAWRNLAFQTTAAAVNLMIDTSGNVGIGTTAPVNGTAIMNGNVGIGTWSPREELEMTSGRILLGDSSAPGVTTNKLYATTGNLYWNGVQLDVGASAGGWVDGGTNVFEATTSDKVGIGTTTPATTLEIVKQAANPPLMVSSVATSAGDYLKIDSAGNIGIGTTFTTTSALSIMNGNVGIGTWNPGVGALVVMGGNVGIGATNPQYGMETNETSMLFRNGVSIYAYFVNNKVTIGGGAQPLSMLSVANNLAVGSTYYASHAAPADGAIIQGNVGIGTDMTSASGKLVVMGGSVGIGTTLTSSGAGVSIMNGSVGIGTWSPIGQLEVKGGSGATRIWTGAGTDTNALSAGELYVEGDLEVDGTIYGDGSGITGAVANGGGWIDGGANIFEAATTDVVGIGTTTPSASTTFEIVKQASNAPLKISSVATGAGDFLKIDSAGNIGIGTITPVGGLAVMNGNVGIGTISPIAKMDLNGQLVVGIHKNLLTSWISGSPVAAQIAANANSTTSVLMIEGQGGAGSSDFAGIALRGKRGVAGDYTVPSQTNDILGMLTFEGIDSGGSVSRVAAYLKSTVTSVQAGSLSANMQFFTTNSSGSTAVRQTIDSFGNVGIGTTTPVAGLAVMNGNVGIGTWSPREEFEMTSGRILLGDSSAPGTTTNKLYATSGNLYWNGVQLDVGASAGGWIDGGTNVFEATTTDKVGIGTTTPATTLEIVKQSTNAPLMVSSAATSAGDILMIASGGNVGIGTNLTAAGTALTVMNGNVGIGTWSTGYMLDLLDPNNAGTGKTFRLRSMAGGGANSVFSISSGGVMLLNPNNSINSDFINFGGNASSSTSPGTFFTINPSSSNSGTVFKVAKGSQAAALLVDANSNVGLGTATPVGGLTVMGGNVGIGTWSPIGQLEVKGGSGATRIWTGAGTDTNALSAGELYVEGDLEVDGTIYGDGSGITGAVASGGGWVDGGTNIFEATTTDLVGIGTTSPSTTLEIVKQGTNAPLMVSSVATADGNYFVVSSSGNVGIGSINPNAAIDVSSSMAFTDASQHDGNYFHSIAAPAAPSASFFYGMDNVMHVGGGANNITGGVRAWMNQLSNTNTGTISSSYNLRNYFDNTSTGTVTSHINIYNEIHNTSTGIITDAYGIQTRIDNASTGTIGNAYGFYMANPTNAGTLTNTYGIYLENLTTAANNYAIYSAGGKSYFAGNVGIGTFNPLALLATGAGNVGIGTIYPVNGMAIMNGNVGIGTWSPREELEMTSGRILLGDSTAPGTTTNKLYATSGNLYWNGVQLDVGASAGGWIDGGTNVFEATTTDKVGIGTTTPATTLEIVKQSSNAPLMVSSTVTGTGDFLKIDSSGNIGIGTTTPVGALTVMNGNVGIGTWKPAYSLDVKGVIEIGGATIQSDAATGGETVITGGASNIIRLNGANVFSQSANNNLGSTSYHWNTARLDTIYAVNVGIGTTLSANRLDVQGGVGIGTSYAGYTSAPANGLIVQGSVGIGTTIPVGALAIMNGNVGIGTWSPIGQLEVKGGNGATRIWTGAGTDTNATAAGELYVEGDLEVDGTIYGDGSGITGGTITNAGGWTDGGTNVYTSTTTDNVGIGTTTPNGATLEVVKNAAQPPLKISSTATGAGDFFLIASGGNVGIGTINPLAGLAVMNGDVGIGTIYPVGGTAIMNGNVGIGTWSPVVALQLGSMNGKGNSTSAGDSFRILGSSQAVTGSGNLNIFSTSNFAVGFGGQLSFGGEYLANSLINFASIAGRKENGTGADSAGYLQFITRPNGSSPAERMRITSLGNVGIGTTTPVGALTIMNGNVGIGTWSPLGALEIKGGQGATRIWTGTGTDTNALSAGELYVEGDLEVDGTIYGDGSGITALPSTLAAGGWVDGGPNVYQSTTTDNVGIGTTTPATTLEIVKSSNRAPLMVSSVATGTGDFLKIDSAGNVGIGTILTTTGALSIMNGNVGIGTWNPAASLDVRNDQDNITEIRVTNASNGTNSRIRFSMNQGPTMKAFFQYRADINSLQFGANVINAETRFGNFTNGGTVTLYTDAAERMRVDANGNVGIGTVTPTSLLNVAGSASVGSGLAFRTTAAPSDGLLVQGNVGVGTVTPVGALTVMNGNVGIGTWSPTTQLQVIGNVGVTDEAYGGTWDGSTNVPTKNAVYDQIQTLVVGGAGGWIDGGTNVFESTTSDVVGIGTTTPSASTTLEIVKQSSNAPLKISSAATGAGDYLTIDSSGNVGIGTTATAGAMAVMNGNVGIGTWSPTGKLVVMGGNVGIGTWATSALLDVNGQQVIGNAGSAAYLTLFGTDDRVTNVQKLIVQLAGGNFLFKSSNLGVSPAVPIAFNARSIIFQDTGNNEFMRIAANGVSGGNVGIGTSLTSAITGLSVMNGNVGIGTWNARSKLDVVGTVNATAFVGDGSGLTGIGSSGWTDGGTNVYTSTTTDNVGIGTTTPNAATLEIVKNAAQPPLKISSTATASGDYFVVSSAGSVGIGTTLSSSGTVLTVMNGNVGIGTWSADTTMQIKGLGTGSRGGIL